jgi:hypothetical protein
MTSPRAPDPLGVPPPFGPGARGEVMFVFPRRLVVGDVSVIHPAVASFAVGAARTPGFAAAARDASKRRAYRQVSSVLPFVPMSVESFGRLGAPALTLLGDLADQAVQAGGPGLSPAAWGASGASRCPLHGQRVPVSVRHVPLAGLRCAVSPGPRLRLFRPVSRLVCGFGVFGSASLCVA